MQLVIAVVRYKILTTVFSTTMYSHTNSSSGVEVRLIAARNVFGVIAIYIGAIIIVIVFVQ